MTGYIYQFDSVKSSSIQWVSKCPICGSESWKNASLIHIESKSRLSKLCAPPEEPKKPSKPLPKVIRASLGILVALLFFMLGFYLLANTRTVGNYLGIQTDSHPLLLLFFLILYAVPLLILFFSLIVESIKAGFTESNYEERLKKYNTYLAPRYNNMVENYPHLRVCMRCGHQFLGR